jgi:hypothetical protein
MSHVLFYRGLYFRVEIAEVAGADDPAKSNFVAWASEAFRELAQGGKQVCSRFVPGQSATTQLEALDHAFQWIRSQADSREAQAPPAKPAGKPSVLYTVWLFKAEDDPVGFDFENFWEAEAFAETSKKTVAVLKVGIKNNESPQFLTVWERGK